MTDAPRVGRASVRPVARTWCGPPAGWFVALSLAALSAACARPTEAPMNVLLVTLDTTRADYLGCYTRGEHVTPNFDRVAREGTRFDLAISTSALTPVSHASILTGLNNMRHGLRVLHAESAFRLPDDVPTLARTLKSHGYATSAFHSAFPVAAHFGLDQGFDVFQSFEAPLTQGAQNTWWDIGQYQRRSDKTTDLAIEHLRSEREPFFTWVHYWDPHDGKLVPPEEFWPKAGESHADASEAVRARELYAAEIRYVDHEFGRLVAELERQGRWADTIVVLVADHGEGLGDHGWQGHRVLYQEQIRVPLIVRVPKTSPTTAVSRLVRTIDIFPTVLDYLGIAPPRPVQGRTLRPLIEGSADSERSAYADQINGFDLNAQKQVKDRPLDAFLYCAMDARWKLVYRPHEPMESELFDLVDDPRETRNLYAERRDEAARLLSELAVHAGWVTEPFKSVGGSTGASSDPRGLQAALASLGYAGLEGEEPSNTSLRWTWVCPRHPAVSQTNDSRCTECEQPLIPEGAGR